MDVNTTDYLSAAIGRGACAVPHTDAALSGVSVGRACDPGVYRGSSDAVFRRGPLWTWCCSPSLYDQRSMLGTHSPNYLSFVAPPPPQVVSGLVF